MTQTSVLVGIGVEVNFEVIAAASLLRTIAPELRVRVVNVTDLMILCNLGLHPHSLSDDAFRTLFTEDRAVVVNYHGYPVELRGLIFGRPNLDKWVVKGYQEEGTTTTPFDVRPFFFCKWSMQNKRTFFFLDDDIKRHRPLRRCRCCY
jgi:xylulose-5-phosphate/fructose-6-phosphate phosphoketolase